MAEQNTNEKKEKKPNIFVRFGKRIAKFFRDYHSEMKKVVWMSFSDVKKNTVLVVVSVLSIGIAIGIIDLVFSQIINGLAGLIG